MEKEGSVLNFMGFSFFYIHQHRCLFFTTFLHNTLHLTKCFRLRPLVDGQYFTSELVLFCLFYSATVYYYCLLCHKREVRTLSMQLDPSEWPCEQSYWVEHLCAVNYCPAVARIWVCEFIPKEWRVSLVCRLDFHRLPGPVFDPPRSETISRDECRLIFPNSGW